MMRPSFTPSAPAAASPPIFASSSFIFDIIAASVEFTFASTAASAFFAEASTSV